MPSVNRRWLDQLFEELEKNQNHPSHGTKNGYLAGCRCDKCTQAERKYRKELRARRLAEMKADPNHKLHGTTTGYKYGCRCDRCEQAGRGLRGRRRKTKGDQ